MVREALLDNAAFLVVGAPVLFLVSLGAGRLLFGLSAVAAVALAAAVTAAAGVLAVRGGSDGSTGSEDGRSSREQELGAKKGSYGSDH
jgi:hypothetical protein